LLSGRYRVFEFYSTWFPVYADKSAQFIGNRIGAFVTISRVQ
jgi:hypothetical protein